MGKTAALGEKNRCFVLKTSLWVVLRKIFTGLFV